MTAGRHTSRGSRPGWLSAVLIVLAALLVLIVGSALVTAGLNKQNARDTQGSCIQEHLKDPSIIC